MYILTFYLYEVKEQIKPIWSERNQHWFDAAGGGN